jgi:ketosteroid isomerase-like protein
VRAPPPPTAAAISFIDRINRSDLDGLGRLMTADHTLQVFEEDPLVGRDDNIEAWRGYFAAFPRYVIYPRRIAVRGDVVAVQGHTTGSHLELTDEDELALSVIWLVTVADGAVSRWQLVPDTAANRREHGLA